MEIALATFRGAERVYKMALAYNKLFPKGREPA
jgi:hypothetical protein